MLAGRYEILETVGRGGMGAVYKARDTRLETVVAVKQMLDREERPEHREAAVRQFQREARILGQLSHPGLPRVTDYFVEEERWHLVMEFVEGRTLEALLSAAPGVPLPLRDVLDWGIQLADVLAYLHGQNPPIVFRDMKPANVIVTPGGTVKLIDFGIARRFTAGAARDTLLYGSPGYSPPEQYGRTQTDPRADIYALGATLHHLLTGRDPAPTPFKFPPLCHLVPTLPAALESLVARCLAMDEDRRIQTAEEVRDELIRIRAALPPLTARPPHAVARPERPWVGRGASTRRAGLALAGILLALLAGAAAWWMWPAPAPRPPARQPPPAPIPDPAPAGGLRITSDPPGVRVILNDQEVGLTPHDAAPVEPGIHVVRLVPPPESGLEEWERRVQVRPGETLVLEASLASASTARAQFEAVEAAPFADSGNRGLRVRASFRLVGAAGKDGLVTAFFYGADRATPLPGPANTPSLCNAQGQLSVSRSIQPAADPADFPDCALFVPDTAFPVPYEQASYQVIVFVDGKPAGSTDIRPVLQADPGPVSPLNGPFGTGTPGAARG